ncbi:MAG TPA: hypothetical protein PLN33_06555 [Hyphomonadaceae bacterium]|jgi:hypothetical protein|nr:hypothetical protein [Hyphomonadaceae bacterium]HPN06178.1 hypothetical protein [Hyphomonadaceae bacterium]
MLLRLFFDAGSGVLLWAYDDEAKARFGYPVEAEMLDITPELRAEIEQLITDYDDTFPWGDPASGKHVEPDRTMFGYEDNPPFKDRVGALLPKLRAALPHVTFESDYEG